MTDEMVFPDWRELVRYASPGPQPTIVADEPEFRVLIAGLEPGGHIPPHAGPRAVYHFLEGEGVMIIDDEPHHITAGMTAIAPAGAVRGISATTRLAFLGVRVGAEGGGHSRPT
jgi:quercetin dioxygenase-like cupin family protein